MYGFKWFWNCKYATSQMLLLLHYITKTFAKTIFISRIDYTNRLQNLLKKVQWFNSWQINSPLQISYELEVGYKIKPRDCMASWSHSLLAPDDIQHDWTFLTCFSYCDDNDESNFNKEYKMMTHKSHQHCAIPSVSPFGRDAHNGRLYYFEQLETAAAHQNRPRYDNKRTWFWWRVSVSGGWCHETAHHKCNKPIVILFVVGRPTV